MIIGAIVLVLAAAALIKLGALKVWVVVLSTGLKTILLILLVLSIILFVRYFSRRIKKG